MAACLGVEEGFESVLVRHKGSRALYQGKIVVEADAAVVVVGVEEAHCQVVGSVGVVIDLEAAHTVVAVHPVEEDSVVVAAAAAAVGVVVREEMREAEDTTGRLAEAQNTVVDLADGLLFVNMMYDSCQRITAYHIHLFPVVLIQSDHVDYIHIRKAHKDRSSRLVVDFLRILTLCLTEA